MKRKVLLISICVILVALIAVGSTFALLSESTDSIINIFDPTELSSKVVEDFDGTVKENVVIKNTSIDVKAYIRSFVVFTWKNDNGEVYPVTPVEGTDYSITWGSTANWDLDTTDGYYYHKSPVAPGASTKPLIVRCEPNAATTPAGYHLEVEIIADAIQASPTSVVASEWGVKVSGTSISK